MRVTSKGRVTIPIAIRAAKGLQPGTEVEFELVEGGVVVRRSTTDSPGRRLIERMRRASAGKTTMSTEELMSLTRDET